METENFTLNLISSHNLTSNEIHLNPPTFTRHSLIKFSVLLVIAAVSMLGNVAMVLSIARGSGRKSSVLYKLLLHLALADLLVTFWCIFGEAAWTYTVEWIADNALCKIFKYFQVMSLYLSTFITVAIALDRLRAIRQPFKRIAKSRGYCTKYILVSWTLSGILSSPQLAVFRVARGPFEIDFFQCVTYGFYTAQWQEQLYSIFSILTMFVIPLVAFVIIYGFIFVTISGHDQRFLAYGEAYSKRNSRLRRAKLRTLRISLVIVACFLVCWTPYYVMMIVFVFAEPTTEVGDDLMSAIFFFGMSSSLVNPVIYGAFHLWQPTRYLPSSFTTSKESSRRGSQRPALMAAAFEPIEEPTKKRRLFLYKSKSSIKVNSSS